MRKVIIAAILIGVSASAMADETINIGQAKFDLINSVERVLILNEGVKDARMMAYNITSGIEQGINAVIAEGLNNSASCEMITAFITEKSRDRFIIRAKSQAGKAAAEKLLAAQATYTMAQCYNLKG